MAFSKHSHYKEKSQITSSFFKALGFPGRLEVLIKLQLEGPLTVQALAKGHPICMETLSGHLKILRKVHLVIAEERYPYTFYSVHEKNMKKAQEMLSWFFSHFMKDNA